MVHDKKKKKKLWNGLAWKGLELIQFQFSFQKEKKEKEEKGPPSTTGNAELRQGNEAKSKEMRENSLQTLRKEGMHGKSNCP